jgi:hypothetical protein
MTRQGLYAVGFCAHYSQQGDWAFNYALKLAKSHGLQLNVFHFLEDPYDPADDSGRSLLTEERAKVAIQRERELRLYYDELAGDYLDVGFRFCEDNEWTELHRCLIVREFQVLVLASISEGCVFAGKRIEEFAHAFVSPVVLVGPNSPDQMQLNTRAAMMADELGLSDHVWKQIASA